MVSVRAASLEELDRDTRQFYSPAHYNLRIAA
jgi:hypothetical protein